MASNPDISAQPTISPAIQRAVPPDQGSLAALLQFEAEIRRWRSVPELVYHLANESRRIVAYDQLFVLRHARLGDRLRIEAASSLPTIDRNAPLIQAIEAGIAALGDTAGLAEARAIDGRTIKPDQVLDDYPFPIWHWQPLTAADGQIFGGLLFARTEPFREGEIVRVERIAETAGHAWSALTGGVPVRRIRRWDKRTARGALILAAVIALFPVRMTALAPVEVVGARPFVVAAPFAGVVSRIEVAPNAAVQEGQVLVTFDDTKVRNEFEVAAEKVQVARAKVERSTSAAFAPGDETHELTINQAERDLAEADYAYARDLLAHAQLRAPRAGVALYSDRRDWEGRAVSTGEPILQIVDPRQVEFRVDLPTKEQLELESGSEVKVWLDADPLWALSARLQTVSYQARETPGGVLSFPITARPLGAPPRIGSRGTAKVHGGWAPLIYTLLKRPISSARQYLGL